ncbi:MAG: hypothetical protein R3A12_12515 [Ignavibacteria bacterium]
MNSGGDRNIQLAESIQNMLKEIGVNMKMNIMREFAQHLDNIDAGRADLFRLGWIARYPDRKISLISIMVNVPKRIKAISPINSTRSECEFDALFEKAIATTDQKARYELYYQAEQIATDKPSSSVLHERPDSSALKKGFRLIRCIVLISEDYGLINKINMFKLYTMFKVI